MSPLAAQAETNDATCEQEQAAEQPEISDRKAQKKMVKQQQREKRQMKKQLKNAFSTSIQAQVANNITEAGGIRKGVSVKKIY